MKTKKDKNYSFNHVNDRLKERFNLSISMKDFDYYSDKFCKDKLNLILVENKDQEIHRIKFKHKLVTFVYSNNRGYITTVLKFKDR
jgi:hypothetical protein